MGQKVHPLGFRLRITQDHRSSWFANQKTYPLILNLNPKGCTVQHTLARET